MSKKNISQKNISKKSDTAFFSRKRFFPHTNFHFVEEKNQPEIPLHTHDFGEIVFIINGTGVHVTKDGRYNLQRGDVFVVDGIQKHGFIKTESLHLINILYCHKRFNELKIEFTGLPGFNVLFVLEPNQRKIHDFKSKLRLNDEQLNEIIPVLKIFIKEAHLALPWGNTVLESFFKAIVVETCRFYSNNKNNKAKKLFKIEKALHYISDNIGKHITLNELAEIAELNIQTFRILFEKATGHKPFSYIIALRISVATRLLVEENLSVSEIAERVGFNNRSYFVRKFKELMGVTPGVYAKSRIE